MSNLDAKIAIWITKSPRPEHEKAVHWLNETLPVDTAFYLLKIEAFKIGDSDPAPLLTTVAGPSVESKQIGGEKKELAERHLLRLEFWKQLLESAKPKTRLFERISPGKDSWIATGAGKSGVSYAFVVRMKDANVELYIDRKKTEENKKIFDTLMMKRSEIEGKFGSPLEWQRLDNRRACRIRYLIEGSGLENRDNWIKLQEQLIDSMIRLHKVFHPLIQSVNIQ
jgi:hypothetical protein